jgi:mRNA interferase MazF
VPLPQADGKSKHRPALVLRVMPGFGDLLVCGISTQLRRAIPGFDEVIRRDDADFAASGLLDDSVIRLGFLAVLPCNRSPGVIGAIGPQRYHRLMTTLGRYLAEGSPG